MFKVAGIIISLAFMYSLMSILVSEVNDIISDILNWRAKRLKKEIEKLLRDTGLRREVLSHPLIDIIDESEIEKSPSGKIPDRAAKRAEDKRPVPARHPVHQRLPCAAAKFC